MDFLSFRITSSYIVPFSCTYNGHQKSNCLLISSKLDVVKSLWNRLQSIVPDRIENGEKPCIFKDFLVLCFTSRCRIGATPKRKVVSSSLAGGASVLPVFGQGFFDVFHKIRFYRFRNRRLPLSFLPEPFDFPSSLLEITSFSGVKHCFLVFLSKFFL